MLMDEMKNVMGEDLESCSGEGMALTGFTRDGHCSHHSQDEGSHHICVRNINGKFDGDQTFCELTNQSNWCATQDTCHDDINRSCDRDNWCVCEWAFDEFVKQRGCDAFEIDCSATNRLAIKHYEDSGKSHALDCIKRQCMIE